MRDTARARAAVGRHVHRRAHGDAGSVVRRERKFGSQLVEVGDLEKMGVRCDDVAQGDLSCRDVALDG